MNEENNTGWALIPPWILTDPKLSASAKLIAGRIWGLSGGKGFCWSSNSRLGAELGLSSKSVSRIISSLHTMGYVNVEVIRDENKEIKQRRIYPANPLYPKMSIGMLKNEHRYAQKCGRENTDEKKDLETTTTKSPPVVVVDDDNNDKIKTPCQSGHKCNDFKDLERVKKAKEIYKAAAAKKTIKNPVGYVCGVCRKGAFLPPDHEAKSADQAARREAEKAAKIAAEQAAREAEEKDARARAEFLNLPDDVKANYLNKIIADLPSNFNFGEAAVCAMAAAKWAQEANYA